MVGRVSRQEDRRVGSNGGGGFGGDGVGVLDVGDESLRNQWFDLRY